MALPSYACDLEVDRFIVERRPQPMHRETRFQSGFLYGSAVDSP